MGPGKGPSNDDDEFFVSAYFKFFRKGVCSLGRGPLMMVKDSLLLLISKCFRKGGRGWQEGSTNDN